MGMLDWFLPNSSNYLTPDQQGDAGSLGLMNAGLNMIDASSNQYGLPKSPFQIGAAGLRGYGAGAQGYLTGMNDMNTTAMGNLTTQRALQHFYPNNKAGAMAGAMTPTSGISPITPPPSTLSGYYNQPQSSGPIPTQPTPAFAQAALGAPSQIPPMTASAINGDQSQAQQSPDQQNTAFGVDVPTMARQMYSQGIDMSFIPSQAAAGAELMKQAIAIDPTIVRSTAYATSQGQLPGELTKIGATGAQSRQTEGYKATITPAQQQVMIGGQLTTVPTNNMALATGKVPNLSSFYSAPQTAGQAAVSTAIPASAKTQSDKLGEGMAEAQEASSLLDSRMSNALSMIQQMKDLAPKTYGGYSGQAGNAIAREIGTSKDRHSAQEKFEQLNSNLFTQELPGIIKGAGGRLDIPLLNAIKQASAIDPFEAPATKADMLQNLQGILLKAQKNAANNVANLSGQTGIQSQPNTTGQIQTILSPSDPAFSALPKGSQFLDQNGVLRQKH